MAAVTKIVHNGEKTKLFRAIVSQKPDLQNNRVVAFAGIGRPQKFYTSLQELGIEIIKTYDFPDHHEYAEIELQDILAFATENKVEVITTSKDFVKIPVHLRPQIKVLEINIEWENKNGLQDFILTNLSKRLTK